MPIRGWSKSWAFRTVLISVSAAVALGIAFLSPLRERWSGPPLEQGRLAYDRRDWSSAVSLAERQLAREPENREALRLKSRGLARVGKDREALAVVASRGGAGLEAEDLFLTAEGLIRRKSAALGRAALEAANRLDPKHAETLAALRDLQRSREPLNPADSRIDRLLAVSDPQALSELVIGLAAIESESSGPILARLLRRDRAEFAAIASAADARKLVARLLLDDGRTGEARAWLAGRPSLSSDPEANWLLSRAALVEGAHDEANAAVERSGDFGKATPIAHEPSRYVGAKTCAKCHGTIYHAQQNGNHASTFAAGESLKKLPYPAGPFKDPVEPKVVHRFDPSGEDVKVSAEVDGKLIKAVVDYALGSGHHGFSLLAREESGSHRSLRLSYYNAGKTWGVTGGFNPHPTDPESFLGERLPTDTFRACLNCHTTRFLSEEERTGPEAADRGIGCERCHGPGDHHVRAVDSGFPQLAIARPKIASHAARMALCAQCHRANGEIPPSDPRFVRFQSTTLPYSRCMTESGGKLDCMTCHDPHRNVETSRTHYDSRCLNCHGGDRPPEPPNIDRVAASRCPVNPKTDCTKCHMPKVDDAMPFSSFTDHHIRVLRTGAKPKPPGASP